MNTRTVVPTFENFSSIWKIDGALRDVVFRDIDISDWHRFCRLIDNGHWPHAIRVNGVESDMEVDAVASNVLPRCEDDALLRILVGGASVHCRFDSVDEIELDISPRDVTCATTHDAIIDFVQRIAKTVGQDATISVENMRDAVLCTYCIRTSTWRAYASERS